ncbi:MAG: hypothetical protein K2Q22_05755, partial [Cytophagales bacterium]|nr:hypothetical protein [Cytophagales bacterium]
MKENDFTLMIEEVQNQLLDLLNEEDNDLHVVKMVFEMFMLTAKGISEHLQELRWNSQLPSETFQENVI